MMEPFASIRRLVAVLLVAGCCVAQAPAAKETTVAPDVLARYVGVYAMSPTANMTITLVDGQLMSQMTGQGQIPLAADSETTFTPIGVNAQIEFPKDATDRKSTRLNSSHLGI